MYVKTVWQLAISWHDLWL